MSGRNSKSAPAVNAKAHLEGLLSWWTLAGVDAGVSEDRVDWLHLNAPVSPMDRNGVQRVEARGRANAPPSLPDSLTAFHEYLAHSPDLPERRWPGPHILPRGPQAPQLMIIVHAPDSAAKMQGEPLEPDAMRLLARITRAISVDLEHCYVATLSLASPPGGLIEPTIAEQLAQRMRHHIGLVAPQALLLLGDQTSRALLSSEKAADGKNLPFVNHLGGTVDAVSIVHPRLMLGQPSAKAEAWRSLRQLVEGWGQ